MRCCPMVHGWLLDFRGSSSYLSTHFRILELHSPSNVRSLHCRLLWLRSRFYFPFRAKRSLLFIFSCEPDHHRHGLVALHDDPSPFVAFGANGDLASVGGALPGYCACARTFACASHPHYDHCVPLSLSFRARGRGLPFAEGKRSSFGGRSRFEVGWQRDVACRRRGQYGGSRIFFKTCTPRPPRSFPGSARPRRRFVGAETAPSPPGWVF